MKVKLIVGPAAFSELETKNVKWLIDNNPTIKYHIDIHSFSQLILYCWGDDQNQTVDPEMNLANPIYDKKRGLGGNNLQDWIRFSRRSLCNNFSC